MTGETKTDDERRLDALVSQFVQLTDAEAAVRAVMCGDDPVARRDKDAVVRRAVRRVAALAGQSELVADTDRRVLVERAQAQLQAYLQGKSRSHNLAGAFENLVGARRMTRQRRDALAEVLDVDVAPFSDVAPDASSEVHADIARRAKTILTEGEA